jgi:hypothetical protein
MCCGSIAGTIRLNEHSDAGFAPGPVRARSSQNLILPRSSPLADGELVSTVIENLLLRKQKLVEQLEKAPSVEDRDQIEHQLEQINTALEFLDRSGSKGAR